MRLSRLSEVHRKTGAKLFSNGTVRRNFGTKQKVTSQIRSHNTIVDEFGTSLPLNFGKANLNMKAVRFFLLTMYDVTDFQCVQDVSFLRIINSKQSVLSNYYSTL